MVMLVLPSFDYKAAAEHAHGARERKFARLLGQEFDRDRFAGRQLRALVEVGEDNLIRAGSRLLAPEIEAHRPAMPNEDRVGRIAALHQDHRFLIAAGYLGRAHAYGALEPKEPDDECNEREARSENEPSVGCHDGLLGSKKRRRLALVTTVTELNAIAAAAMSGESRRPRSG